MEANGKTQNVEIVRCACGCEIGCSWIDDAAGPDLMTFFIEHRPDRIVYHPADRCVSCGRLFTYRWYDRAQERQLAHLRATLLDEAKPWLLELYLDTGVIEEKAKLRNLLQRINALERQPRTHRINAALGAMHLG